MDPQHCLQVKVRSVLRIRIRNQVVFWPLDPGSRSGKNFKIENPGSEILSTLDTRSGMKKSNPGFWIRDVYPGSATLIKRVPVVRFCCSSPMHKTNCLEMATNSIKIEHVLTLQNNRESGRNYNKSSLINFGTVPYTNTSKGCYKS
jgi:hypothetical protein